MGTRINNDPGSPAYDMLDCTIDSRYSHRRTSNETENSRLAAMMAPCSTVSTSYPRTPTTSTSRPQQQVSTLPQSSLVASSDLSSQAMLPTDSAVVLLSSGAPCSLSSAFCSRLLRRTLPCLWLPVSFSGSELRFLALLEACTSPRHFPADGERGEWVY